MNTCSSSLTPSHKIKYYLEGSGSDATEVAELLPQVVNELADEWMQAKENNLGRP